MECHGPTKSLISDMNVTRHYYINKSVIFQRYLVLWQKINIILAQILNDTVDKWHICSYVCMYDKNAM